MKVRMATGHFYMSVSDLFHRLYKNVDFGVIGFKDSSDVDLIVFSGGADINPDIYGEENYHSYCNLHRDKREIDVFDFAQENDIPCFGICRGHQMLNALVGGKLIQHIDIPHPSPHILDSGQIVNSLHHQGVIKTPLDILGSFEGVVEITKGEKIFSVQFHPEFSKSGEMDYIVRKGLIW